MSLKLIQVKSSINRLMQDLREARQQVDAIRQDEQYAQLELDQLLANMDELERCLQGVLPPSVATAVEEEIQRLTLPQFGWCSECGAEWGYKLSSPKEPADRCGGCKAPAS